MNARPHTDPAHATPAPLCPIPRSGIPGPAGILLFLLLTVASAMVGIGLCAAGTTSETAIKIAEGISIVTLILLALYLWRVTRTAKGILPVLIFSGIAVFYFTGSIILSAVLCSLIFSIGEGSFLLAVLPRQQLAWIPIVPILAYAAALALSRDPVGAASALIPFPPMIVLAMGTRNAAAKEDGLTRVGVICATSLTLGISLIAMILLAFYRHVGTLSLDAFMDGMEALRTAMIQQITSAEIPEGLAPEMVAEMEAMLTYSNAQNMVNSVFNLLPAIFVVMVNLISAGVQVLLHASLRAFGFGESVTDRVRTFRMSLISCIVFLVAYLVSFLESGDTSTLAGTVAQNIYVIFMPGLALAGMLRLIGGLTRKGVRGMGCLFYVIILIPCLLIFAPFVLAAVEVIGHIYTTVISAFHSPDDDDPFGKT